ncbi:MAG: diacylglycerol kinase family lipid kinase [Parvibaculum sp.]|uniref:diacylglycerol/lipid kinase family protein n=1 Tax=Parvibaculum sp. TaxID=2024848 RepID=UPI00283B4117|nr:diacylglycerol kinase family lipid kinase [Parvibaculum sp.]MDR3497964.1 diacylglycerol kinase family lipid kinase [Parvibaculum sp.]
MAAPHVAAVVNPRSGGGRTGRSWRLIRAALERELGPIRPHFTQEGSSPRYLPAAELARKALGEGAQLVVAVGGDGTINEVVNGFFENGAAINPDAHFAVLNTGTGGDFRKTFGLPETLEACAAGIGAGTTRGIDLGRLTFASDAGGEAMRYFDNIASFGISGEVVRAVNRARFSKLFGGSFTFLWATLSTALRYKPMPVRLVSDTGFDEIVNIGTCAVANGKFFGGGMKVAPNAEPDDGMFDVIVMRDTTFGDLFTGAGALREGTHLDNPKVTHFRARTLTATPAGATPSLLDVDGEAPGRLPARFDILPGAITLRC